MDKTPHRDRLQRLLPIMASAVIIAGLLMMVAVFRHSQDTLVDSQDSQLMRTAQSVDNNIIGHFNWYCSDLAYVISRWGFKTAERRWLNGEGADELLRLLRETPLSRTEAVENMLVVQDGAAVLSTEGPTDYTSIVRLGENNGADIWLCLDGGGQLCVALVQPGENAKYAAVINGETFFALAERLSAAETRDQILLMDAAGQYFFHRTAQGVHVETVEEALALDADAHSGLRQMLEIQESGQPGAAFFRADSLIEGEHHTARIAILPAPDNVNGCFTVGIAGSYDQIVRPLQSAAVQMILCSGAVVAGAAILLLFLLRSRRHHQQTQAELDLLRQKTRAMEELSAQTQQIAHRQRLETIGTLTSGIAHEFNNLLTPIMGYSILILEKLPAEDTESYDNALEIYKASQKAKKIISRLSNLSRKNTAQTFRAVSPDRLAEQVLEVAGPVRPKTVHIETGFACGGQDVLGDETQLFQLLLNLVLNAFEALGAQGGTVRVSTAAQGSHVVLRVADNGPGIPEEARDKIFDPFFTTKGSGKGIGLGLAIVYQIVETHGGSITMESAAGQGTAFTVSLPAVQGEAPPATEQH